MSDTTRDGESRNEGTTPAEISSPSSDYVAAEGFDELPLSEPVREGIRRRGYTRPTPVQAAVIRPILSGRDVIVRSKTGTGKTAAFGIPLVEAVDTALGKVQALVLCNTRELALQVATELGELGTTKGVKVVAIYGGASMDAQLKALEGGAQIAVGTPGRILDLLERRTLSLADTRIGVLDEADEMLGMGFYEDVMRILGKLPRGHQTLLFSATVSPEIEQIVRTHLRDPETILLSGDTYTVEGIRNILYYAQDAYPKPRNLLYMLQLENPESAIVFCNTRDDVNLVTTVLNRNGFDADKLSGELPQKERERVMAKIKRGEVQFMVATDLAARGIDISDLTHVINYSLPEDPAVYLHRIGRTGRIGKTGTALSLVRGTELVTLTALQKKYGISFEERKLPTPEEARRLWTDTHVSELKSALGSLVFDAYLPLAQELRKRDDGDLLVAFALKYFFTNHRKEKLAAPRQDEDVRTVQDKQEAHKERLKERRSSRAKPKLETAGEAAEREREKGKDKGKGREKRRRVAADAAETTPAPSPETPPSAEAEKTAPAGSSRRRNRLFVTVGTSAGVDETSLKEAVAALAGLPSEAILSAELREKHSYLEVEPGTVDAFLAASGRTFRDEPVTIEVARPPRRGRR